MQNLKQPSVLGVVLLTAFFFVPLQPGRAQVLVAGGSGEPPGIQASIFVSATGQFPPSPFNPLPDLPLAGDDGLANNQVYVVDDRDFDFSAFWADTAPARNNGGMLAMDDGGPPTPEGGTNSNGGGGGADYGARWTTNDLWLEIVSETDQTAALVIHQPWNAAVNGVYDVVFTTNLTPPAAWQWVMRTAQGQTNLVVSNLPPDLGFFRLGLPTVIRPGFDQQSLGANDDDCYNVDGYNGDLLTNLWATIGFPINFFGNVATNLYVNNNGNATFETYLSDFTPVSLQQAALNDSVGIIAPFWADVDTRGAGSGMTTYGTNTVDGQLAFGISWIGVGYYWEEYDKLNTFQLVLVDRSARASGDYDVEFNYARVQWEAGNASGGNDGIWTGHYGCSARVGFASASGANQFEMAGSGTSGAFLDANPGDGTPNSTGLIYTNFNSTVPGRFVFQFHDGSPLAVPAGNSPQMQLLPELERALYNQLNQAKGK